MPPQPSAVARGHPPGCSVLPVSAGQRDSATHLIQDVLADELADRHESLRPLLVCVPGANLHWDRSAASNFLDILQTIRKTRVVTVTTVQTLVGPSAKRSHACALIARPREWGLLSTGHCACQPVPKIPSPAVLAGGSIPRAPRALQPDFAQLSLSWKWPPVQGW